MPRFCSGLLLALSLSLLAGRVLAADEPKNIFESLGTSPLAGDDDNENPVTVSARLAAEGRAARLEVAAEIAKGYHIYSITQPKGGPVASKITLEKSDDYELAGEFEPSIEPQTHVDDRAYKGLTLEEHEGHVAWTAPVKLTAGVDAAKLVVRGKLFYQACNASGCRFPTSLPFEARLAAGAGAAQVDPPGVYTKDKQVRFAGHLEPKTARPGDKVKLVLRAEPAEGWHLYELLETAPNSVNSKPTLLVLEKAAGLSAGSAKASMPAHEEAPGALAQYREPVEFSVELVIDKNARPGETKLAGVLAYQTCTDLNCAPPTAVGFEVALRVADEAVAGQVPLTFTGKQAYAKAEKLSGATAAFDLNQVEVADARAAKEPLWQMIFFGFLGGAILNLMPCVLPVIGLKILSFVEQSQHSRRQGFLLNIWYSLGMLAVFMVLATLPVAARAFWGTHFGWGQQFAFDGFNITLTAIVFVMALSFLGVWEIPIPGFVGSGKANELAAQEGAVGAFCKGAITTVLATPCSGPFLGTALAFAAAEPPQITFAMFAAIGLGMASPYLLIGAFPNLIRFLPKPGAWMDTFKQAMGFVLLATVVYLLTLVEWQRIVPTLALLMGLWAGCWWVGRVPLYAGFPAQARAWAGAVSFAVLVGLLAFQKLAPIMESRLELLVDKRIALRLKNQGAAPAARERPAHELPWQPFSLDKFSEYTAQGKTILVDFTADWCLTCKTLEATVLNTAQTSEFVRRNGVITMVADMTHTPPDESAMLHKLTQGGDRVPVVAIFPSGRPNQPLILADLYTSSDLLSKLQEAGPSKAAGDNDNANDNATAMKLGK